ncbi:hypothetical protein CsSME_00025552 [Camellia sinensis var. sinensis]
MYLVVEFVLQILETAFKKETVGLVTREQYVEKRVNIRTKIEEEEKEKLLKLQQEEEELQAQKRQKRKIRGNPRLSFSEDIENGSEEDVENSEAVLLTITMAVPCIGLQKSQAELSNVGFILNCSSSVQAQMELQQLSLNSGH